MGKKKGWGDKYQTIEAKKCQRGNFYIIQSRIEGKNNSKFPRGCNLLLKGMDQEDVNIYTIDKGNLKLDKVITDYPVLDQRKGTIVSC